MPIFFFPFELRFCDGVQCSFPYLLLTLHDPFINLMYLNLNSSLNQLFFLIFHSLFHSALKHQNHVWFLPVFAYHLSISSGTFQFLSPFSSLNFLFCHYSSNTYYFIFGLLHTIRNFRLSNLFYMGVGVAFRLIFLKWHFEYAIPSFSFIDLTEFKHLSLVFRVLHYLLLQSLQVLAKMTCFLFPRCCWHFLILVTILSTL